MPTDSGTNDILSLGFLHYTTAVSREMSDEPYSNLTDCITIVGIFYVVYRLYIRSKLILVNPLLSLKYSIYNIKFLDGKISRQGILISKDCCLEEDDCAKIYNVGYQLYFGYKR